MQCCWAACLLCVETSGNSATLLLIKWMPPMGQSFLTLWETEDLWERWLCRTSQTVPGSHVICGRQGCDDLLPNLGPAGVSRDDKSAPGIEEVWCSRTGMYSSESAPWHLQRW